MAALRSLRMMRLLRLMRLMKLMQMDKYLRVLEQVFLLNANILKLIKMLLAVVYLMHLLGCFWYYIGRHDY